jgi:hypothetical protein
MQIIHIIYIIITLRIVVRFQSRHKGAIEGLGSCVCSSRGCEQKQHPSIPDSIRRDNERAIVDFWRPNHDEVQSVTSVKRFCRKRVAVYPLHTFVLGLSKHQAIIQSEMTLVLGRVFQLNCLIPALKLENGQINGFARATEILISFVI